MLRGRGEPGSDALGTRDPAGTLSVWWGAQGTPSSTQIREACLGERDRESGRWLPPRQAASSLLNWFPGTPVQWTAADPARCPS